MRHPASVSVKLPMPSTMRRHNSRLSDEENDQCAEAIEQDDALQLNRLLDDVKSKSDAADQVMCPKWP